MANNENLRPPYSSSEAREFGRKGGIESGKSKRKKRLIRDTIEVLLDQEIKNPEILDKMKSFGVIDKPRYKDYLVVSVVGRTAETGCVTDLIKLSEFLGESPSNQDLIDQIGEWLEQIPSVID